ncbi:MAG: sulfotransferase family 2 domain-containing protein [Pseudomonadota bacterium]
MLIFPEQKLVFFAIPKTGSTAYQQLLMNNVDLAFQSTSDRKHMNVRQFERRMVPSLGRGLAGRLQRFAVMRHPLERMRSWYRYRTRLPVTAHRSTAGISFTKFIEAYLSDEPPEFAALGDQWLFVKTADDLVGIDHLFAIERPALLKSFLADRFGTLPDSARTNVSPEASTDLGADLTSALRAAHEREYALYDMLMEEGGYLHSPRPRD